MFIWPVTIFYLDQWRECWSEHFNLSNIHEKGYVKYSVNHEMKFVDPITSVHTNTIIGLFGKIKNDIRKKHEMRFEFEVVMLILRCDWQDKLLRRKFVLNFSVI